MSSAPVQPHQVPRELQHAIRNFLNLVVMTGEIGLSADLDYSPERALRAILEGAEELEERLRAPSPVVSG